MIQNQFAVPGKINIWETIQQIDFDTTFFVKSKAGVEFGKYSHIENNKLLYLQNHIDKFHYVIHKIIEGTVLHKQVDNERGFINLNTAVLHEMLGARYTKEVLDLLVDLGFTECDKHYEVGEKSKGYRIAAAYQSKFILRDIFKVEVWGPKLRKKKGEYTIAQQKKKSTYQDWKNLQQIGIRGEEAKAFIEARLLSELSELERIEHLTTAQESPKAQFPYSFISLSLMNIHLGEKESEDTDDEQVAYIQALKNVAIAKYNSDLMSIQKFLAGDYFLEQPDSESRIYTNISNLATDLRQFLYHKKNNQPLVNLDIRNSQPYLFSLLLMEYYKGQDLPQDVNKYIELTSTGNFYEFLMEGLGVAGQERKSFKQDFFGKIFYCAAQHSARTKEGQYFAQAFPNVNQVVNHYKEEGRKHYLKKHYKHLPIEMQRKEAGIMLKDIGSGLAESGVWFTGIHDSIVCLEEHADIVRELILNTFFVAVGIPPTVFKESFSKEATN